MLEPDSSNFVVDPYKIIYRDSIFFIKDLFLNSIFAYQSNGKLKFRINSTGEGPHEFLTLDDFSIHHDTIWIKDAILKKELAYDLNGEFILERVNPFRRAMFHKGDNFSLVYLNNDPEFDFRILRYSAGKNIPYIKRPDHLANLITSDPNGFQSGEDSFTYFNLPNALNLLKFDSLGLLKKNYSLDFGSDTFRERERMKFEKIYDQYDYAEENNLVESLSSFLVTNDGFIVFIRRNDLNKEYLFFDKEFNLTYQSKNLINDLDFIPIVEMPWSSMGNSVIYLINSSRLAKFNELNHNEVHPKSNIIDFLERYKNDLKEENYVLALFKLK